MDTKQAKVPYVSQHSPGWWGITDGEKWFFYAYTSKELADAVNERDGDWDPETIRVNISQAAPQKLCSIKDVLDDALDD
jgi:hypothetical protein